MSQDNNVPGNARSSDNPDARYPHFNPAPQAPNPNPQNYHNPYQHDDYIKQMALGKPMDHAPNSYYPYSQGHAAQPQRYPAAAEFGRDPYGIPLEGNRDSQWHRDMPLQTSLHTVLPTTDGSEPPTSSDDDDNNVNEKVKGKGKKVASKKKPGPKGQKGRGQQPAKGKQGQKKRKKDDTSELEEESEIDSKLTKKEKEAADLKLPKDKAKKDADRKGAHWSDDQTYILVEFMTDPDRVDLIGTDCAHFFKKIVKMGLISKTAKQISTRWKYIMKLFKEIINERKHTGGGDGDADLAESENKEELQKTANVPPTDKTNRVARERFANTRSFKLLDMTISNRSDVLRKFSYGPNEVLSDMSDEDEEETTKRPAKRAKIDNDFQVVREAVDASVANGARTADIQEATLKLETEKLYFERKRDEREEKRIENEQRRLEAAAVEAKFDKRAEHIDRKLDRASAFMAQPTTLEVGKKMLEDALKEEAVLKEERGLAAK